MPHERLNKIMRHAHDMAVFSENNAVLRAFGISVIQESNQVSFELFNFKYLFEFNLKQMLSCEIFLIFIGLGCCWYSSMSTYSFCK